MKVVWLNLAEQLEEVCLGPDKDKIKHIELTQLEWEKLQELLLIPYPHKESDATMESGTLKHISNKCEGSASDVNLIKHYFMDIPLIIGGKE